MATRLVSTEMKGLARCAWLPLQVVVFGCRLRGLPRSVGLPRAAASDASRLLGCFRGGRSAFVAC